MFLQNLHKFLSYILYMLYIMPGLVATPKIAQSYCIKLFIKNHFVKLINLPR
jgi:hypothetical protein